MYERVTHIRERFVKALLESDAYLDGQYEYLEIIGVVFQADERSIFGEPNRNYIRRELKWYLSESEYISEMDDPIPEIWKRIADRDGKVSSNYGRRIFNIDYGMQYHQALHELTRNPASRRAVMVYVNHDTIREGIVNGRDDQVCTMYVNVFIRDSYLHYHVHMRSNDAVLGYRNDRAWHLYVRDKLLTDIRHRHQMLHLMPATILWFVDSLHVYEHDVHLVDEWRKENEPSGC